LNQNTKESLKIQSVNVALLAVNSFEDVQKIYKLAKNELLEILSAIEFMDSSSFTATLSYLNQSKPLSESHPFYVLIETQGSNFDHDQEKLAISLEKLLDSGLAKDGLIAQDEAQSQKIWNIRESIQMATQHLGKCYSYDVSIPLPHFYEAVELIKNILSKSGYYKELDPNNSAIQLVCGYGHLGDCNLHLNIVSKDTSDQITSLLEPFIFEVVQKFNGSISAEHGLGFHKAKFIQYSKSDTMIELMKRLKLQFDPNQILNPYKYLPM
jgi:D-lactate dehydrogenase (cytochrome)